MTLRLALVIEGDSRGAADALDETARGVEQLGQKADGAAEPLEKVSDAVEKTATDAPKAASGVTEIGDAVDGASGKFSGFGEAVKGALTDFAGGLAAGAIQAGLELAAGAALSFAENIVSTGPQIEERLSAQADLIERIRDAYSGAAGAATSAGANGELAFAAQQQVTGLRDTISREQRSVLLGGTLSALPGGLGALFGAEPFGRSALGTPFEDSVRSFREALREGTADASAFRAEIASIASSLPLEDSGRSVAEKLLGDTENLAELQTSFLQAIDLYRGLAGDNEALAAALGGTAEEWAEQRSEAGAAIPVIRNLSAEYRSLADAIAGAGAGTPIGQPPVLAGIGRATFEVGGYTGDGGRSEVAGLVHAGEFVINAEATARNRQLLEAINAGLPGYAGGGLVAGSAIPAAGSEGDTLADTFADIVDLAGGGLRSLGEQALRTGNVFGSLDGALDRFGGQLTQLAERRILYGLDGESGLLGGLLSGIGFDLGGYTGDGGRGSVAGVVHGQEFVINAAATARHRPMLEAINNSGLPGFASGGYAGAQLSGPAPVIQFHVENHSRAEVHQPSVEQGPGGEVFVRMIIDEARDAVRADALSGKWDSVFRANGAGPQPRKEG